MEPDLMAILIDGYNLLHASGILSRNIGPGTLERARDGLVGFLAAALDEGERNETTIVFDAHSVPSDSTPQQKREGITVRYAAGYENADQLLAELIRQDSAPRRLVVVSGDREIQRAARRRRATAVESGAWYEDLRRRRRERPDIASAGEERLPPNSAAEVNYWLEVFGEGERPEESGGGAAEKDAPSGS